MSTKRILTIVLVAGTVLLAVGIGPRFAGTARALPPALAGAPAQAGATVPYSGSLADDAGRPVADGAYDFIFALYTAKSGGEPLWTEAQEGVTVQGGAFTVLLGSTTPFPKEALDGGVRWLEVAVRGPGEAEYTALAPRQELSAAAPMATAGLTAPAALSCEHTHLGEVWNANIGWSNAGLRINNSANGPAFWGYNSGGGNGLRGESSTGLGVFGWSNSSYGVFGRSETGYGGGFAGVNDSYDLFLGGPTGRINANEQANSALYLSSNGDVTIKLDNDSGGGGANMLYFLSRGHEIARMDDAGNLTILGNLSKAGGGFRIDHPLDPENRYLNHSFVESPDMMNIYNGNVTLDTNGEAWVELPDWFEALNQDFRYQLTCIGGFAPVYIAQEVQNNRFQIAGGTSGLEVSWQVTGIRHDPYAEAHRIPVEEQKPSEEQGAYLHPLEYGQPESAGVSHQPGPDLQQP